MSGDLTQQNMKIRELANAGTSQTIHTSILHHRKGKEMIIGTGRVVLRLHGVHSLKEKRKIIKSIINRIKNSFNASVAEVGANDSHERGVIGFSLTGNDQSTINSMIDKIFNKIDAMGLAEMVDTDYEIITY